MKKRRAHGFTLIEILASISVLLLLVVVTSQLVGAVSSIFRSGKARVDIFNQARITFGALDRDIRQMVLRPDIAAFTDATGTNTDLAFYTRVQGGEGDRAVSLVRYTLHDPKTDPDQSKPPLLTRCNYGMNFNAADPANTARVPTFGDGTALKDLSNDKVESRELARGVVRLEWRFIDSTGAAGKSFAFNYNDPSATTNTRVVQISLLVLDGTSYDLLIQTGQLPTLLTNTAGTPGTGESLGQYWERLINSGSLSSTLPKPVLKSMRVFERSVIIPLNR